MEIFFVDQFTYLQKKKRPVAFSVSNTKQRVYNELSLFDDKSIWMAYSKGRGLDE